MSIIMQLALIGGTIFLMWGFYIDPVWDYIQMLRWYHKMEWAGVMPNNIAHIMVEYYRHKAIFFSLSMSSLILGVITFVMIAQVLMEQNDADLILLIIFGWLTYTVWDIASRSKEYIDIQLRYTLKDYLHE